MEHELMFQRFWSIKLAYLLLGTKAITSSFQQVNDGTEVFNIYYYFQEIYVCSQPSQQS